MKKSNNLLFYIAYFLVIFSDIFDNVSALKTFLIFVDVLLVLLLCVDFLRKFYLKRTYSKSKLALLFGFLIVVIITALVSNNRALLKLPVLLLAFTGIEFDDFIKKDFYMRSLLIIVIMTLSLLGLTDNTVLEIRNGFARNSFGLGHPNSFAIYIAIVCIDYYYIETLKSKPNILKPIGVAIILSCFIHFFVGSRTNIILIALISLAFIFRNKIKLTSKCTKKIASNAFFILLILSILMAFLYNSTNPIMSGLDKILSRRLYLSNYFVDRYGITLFGTEITNDKFYILDNAYVNLIVRYGIILTIYFVIIYKKTIDNLLRDNKMLLVIIMIVLLIYGLSESPIYIPAKNPYVLLLCYACLDIGNKKREEIENE